MVIMENYFTSMSKDILDYYFNYNEIMKKKGIVILEKDKPIGDPTKLNCELDHKILLDNINKYYTPTIDEFYIGFECEYRVDKNEKWSNIMICDAWDVYDAIIELDEKNGVKNPTWEYRVKYLDKEDIESLGFRHDGSLWFSKENCLTLNNENGLDCRIRMWRDRQIIIWVWYSDEDNHIVFDGTVKNKSELKKLLKQLNIE